MFFILISKYSGIEYFSILVIFTNFSPCTGKENPRCSGVNKMKKLPITSFKNKILETVKKNPVTVITAETGAGKSTQVPQYLLDEGYDMVVTQPRRLAARSVATRVAEERGETIGGTIGYRTAVDRIDSSNTRCLFCTDGLALVRELMGQNRGILILDEVHEWNENMEVLVAWAKSQITTGANMKIVLMSATLESEKLSAFFNNAPIISVPGRSFSVEEREAGQNIETDVATLVAEGRNVLVFQPGKQEIEETIDHLEKLNIPAIILPLHGQLEPSEQAKCFTHYNKPKVIVATNVAQTSVTIDDIDAVVDSGVERRIELVDGVEGLYLSPISLADSKQRRGRAGRTKEGIYIDHCQKQQDRPSFPVAEILRKRLDQTVLRLAITGFHMDTMEFFHQPARADIEDAKKTLVGLGCMTQDGKVTEIGRLVNRLPISVKYGRMLIEANRLGVVNDILSVAAIMEVGGITIPPPSKNKPNRPDWREMVPEEKESDIIAQLKVWEMTYSMSFQERRDSGVSLRKLQRADEIRRLLIRALNGQFEFQHEPLGTESKREKILKAVCSGMVDHLYEKESNWQYVNGDSENRELGSGSVVKRSMPEWIVGIPFDLEIVTKRGPTTLHLVNMSSKIEPSWLEEIAPHLITREVENLYWSHEIGCVVEDHFVIFNDMEISQTAKPAPWGDEAFRVFVESMMNHYTSSEVINDLYRENLEVLKKYDNLRVRSGGTITKIDRGVIRDLYTKELYEKKVLSFDQFESLGINLETLKIKLADLISNEKICEIETQNPTEIEIEGEKFPISYQDKSWDRDFAAVVSITEETLCKIKKLVLPNGRELKVSRNGSYLTLKECREKLGYGL